MLLNWFKRKSKKKIINMLSFDHFYANFNLNTSTYFIIWTFIASLILYLILFNWGQLFTFKFHLKYFRIIVYTIINIYNVNNRDCFNFCYFKFNTYTYKIIHKKWITNMWHFLYWAQYYRKIHFIILKVISQQHNLTLLMRWLI